MAHLKTVNVLRVIALALALPSTALAQSADDSIMATLLTQSFLKCYTAPEGVTPDDTIILQIQLNDNGDIANLPTRSSSAPLTPGARALLQAGTSAVITCTPIVSGGGDKTIFGSFDMVLSSDGLTLENTNLTVGKTDADYLLHAFGPPPESTGTEASESALDLNRNDRTEIQRRLTLLNYNTRGVDGVFGPGSRAAITSWQGDNDLPETGYFDVNQLVLLKEMSQSAFTEWNNRPRQYIDAKGCLREANGVIVQGRSFKCDLSAASQGLGISR